MKTQFRSRTALLAWAAVLAAIQVLASCTVMPALSPKRDVVLTVPLAPLANKLSRDLMAFDKLAFRATLTGESTVVSEDAYLVWQDGDPIPTELSLEMAEVPYGDYELVVEELGRPADFPEEGFARDLILYRSQSPVTIQDAETAISVEPKRLAAEVSASLVDHLGQPVAGATVTLTDQGHAPVTSDAAGRFVFDGVPTSTYRILLGSGGTLADSAKLILYDEDALDLGNLLVDKAPLVGTPTLSHTVIDATHLQIHFTAASDDLTGSGALEYCVVDSQVLGDVNNLAGAVSLSWSQTWQPWSTAIGNITQLYSGGYAVMNYYNVLVRDGVGNMTLYNAGFYAP